MLLVKNGLVIDPANDLETQCDLLLDGGLIKDIGQLKNLSGLKNSETIDAQGCWVLPGLIDMHVHLREPGFEWQETIESGAQAAALGGFTSVACMANTNPVNDNQEITRFILERSQEVSAGARVFPIGSVSRNLDGKEMSPFSELRKAGAVGFSDDGKPIMDANLLRRALEWTSMLDAPVCVHEEDSCLCAGGCMNESALSLRLGLKGRPKMAETAMVARDIEIARATKGRLHFCHLSTARSVELVRRAKNDGINVTAEVAPHHLLLTELAVINYDTNAKMNPPLREEEDLLGLFEGLKDGTIDALATDHAPHHLDVKQIEFDKAAVGVIGLQSAFPLLLGLSQKRGMSKKRLVECFTSAPAKILRQSDLGSLSPGKRADVAIIDPNQEWVFDASCVRSKSKNSPFLGGRLQGRVKTVIRDGRVLVRDEQLEVE